VAALLGCLAFALPALAEEPATVGWPEHFLGDVIVDAVIVRPLAAVGTAIGAALFVPAALLTAPGGKQAIQDALDHFVLIPWDYVANRPLGEF
jgi:hypothetical protein